MNPAHVLRFYFFNIIPSFVNVSTALCSALAVFFSFEILYSVGKTPWTGDQPVANPLPTHRTTQTWNKRIQTSIPQVGFGPTTPVFQRKEAVHALDRADTVVRILILSSLLRLFLRSGRFYSNIPAKIVSISTVSEARMKGTHTSSSVI
jgi:hypothetical protein